MYSMYIYIYIHMYYTHMDIYRCIAMCICVHIFMYACREGDRGVEELDGVQVGGHCLHVRHRQ